MKLRYINQSQPNIHFIINDSSPEFNIPEFDFENKSLYYKKNEYDNQLFKIENDKLNKIFQVNHQKFSAVIFIDPYKDIIKEFNLNEDYFITSDDINISSYISLNNLDLFSIFDFNSINLFSDIENANIKLNNSLSKTRTNTNERLNKIENLLALRNSIDFSEIDNGINKIQWMVDELLTDCTVKFTFFDQFSNEYVFANSILLNNEQYECEYNNNVCLFKIPTYKLIKNDISFLINQENYFPVEKSINKFKYDYIISNNHIIDFGELFSSKQKYSGINYWIELDYMTLFDSDLDLHCFVFNENKQLIDHYFWRNEGNQLSDLQLIDDDVNDLGIIKNEKLLIRNFDRTNYYVFIIDDFLFDIDYYSNSSNEDYNIYVSLFLKDKLFKFSTQHINYKKFNKSYWAVCILHNEFIYELNKFISEIDVPTSPYNENPSEILSIIN